MPRVTVLIPVYNGERHLSEALQSVLEQGFSDFEVLVIDDGSVDGSASIAEACSDPRVRLVRNGRNLGLPTTLNRGLDLSTGEYIARLDCDDVCAPERLERQVRFLDQQADIGLCGTALGVLGQANVWQCPEEHEEIRCTLLFQNCMHHPTIIFRRASLELFRLRYDPAAVYYAEDYELWVRAADLLVVRNLPEPLVFYRLHESQASAIYATQQQTMADAVVARQLVRLGLAPTPRTLALVRQIVSPHPSFTSEEMSEAEEWLQALERANLSCGRYHPAVLRRVIDRFRVRFQ